MKSIHAIRRTVNSNMRCNGVPDTVAASILGNTPEVNTKFYTYDVMEFEKKKKFLKKLHFKKNLITLWEKVIKSKQVKTGKPLILLDF